MSFKGSVMSSQTSKHDIVKVLQHYGFTIPANRGGWMSVRCVFHNDHVKSGRVNIDGGGFKCFACDMAGDVYSIIMKREGVNYGEALKIAEGITGEGNRELRNKSKRGSTISRNSGNYRSNSPYVPPRLRGES